MNGANEQGASMREGVRTLSSVAFLVLSRFFSSPVSGWVNVTLPL